MKILKIILLLLFCFSKNYGQNIVVNEFMSSNDSGITDKDGDRVDWIELFNNSDAKINLEDFMLSDDPEVIDKWIFPNIEIPGKGFLIVFASGKNQITGNELHTNFKLKQSGEALILTDNQGNLMDRTASIFLETDHSFARIPDGADLWTEAQNPTPGSSNAGSGSVVASHSSGFYDDPFFLTLTVADSNQSVFYTFNGNKPTSNDFEYKDAIKIEPRLKDDHPYSLIPTTPVEGPERLDNYIWKTPERVQTGKVIRFAAFDGDERVSPVMSRNFFVGENLSNQYEFPVVNILVDSLSLFGHDSGIYVPGSRFAEFEWTYWSPEGNYLNEGQDWERDMHITFYEPGGEIGFESDGGIRMHGNGSTAFAQKSFKIYFRSEYGMNELDYPIFPDADNTVFKRLLFRNGGSSNLTNRFKDAMLQWLIRDLNIEVQDYRPAIVFINGEYWGIHIIRDKIDRFHFRYNFGADKDSVEVIDAKGRAEEGNISDYRALQEFINTNDMSLASNYDYVSERLDISSIIDAHLSEIFFANYDFPCNNYKVWRHSDPGSKFRFFLYDLDFTFGFDNRSDYDYNSVEHVASDADSWPHCQVSNSIYRGLLNNEEFKKQLVSRFAFLLKTTFDKNRLLKAIDDFEILFEAEMPEHIERWHYPSSMTAWREAVDDLRVFARKRPCSISEHFIEFFELTDFDFDCLADTVMTPASPLVIFPNPNDGNFTIYNGTDDDLRNIYLKIVNTAGQVVYGESEFSIDSRQRFYVNNLDLPRGVYVVVLENDDFNLREKFIFSRSR